MLELAPLGGALGADRPLYGFQPQGLDGALPAHATIEAMAAHYIAEMKSVQALGPYAIGGHCAGSWVAFEMARQLQTAGDEVTLLIYPSGASRFELYEDDGRSNAYRQGRYALTPIECDAGPGRAIVRIGQPTGDPSVMPAGRRYVLRLRMDRPAAVTVEGRGELPRQAGPGAAPALSGPTRKAPPLSIQARLPPPAPISARSMVGERTR